MISAVLDTNVVVSGQLRSTGPPASVVDLALKQRFRCYISESVLLEYEAVLLRAQFDFTATFVAALVRAFRQNAIVVSPRKRLTIATDPSDNHILECALEARADYIVTGNLRHFPSRFQDIRIIGPKRFMTAFWSEL